MAAMDMEEQQQLLEPVRSQRPSRRSVALAVAGLGVAAAAAVVLWQGAPGSDARGVAASHDLFTAKLQQLSAGYAKIRELQAKSGAQMASDPMAQELREMTCDMDQLDIELCGDEETEMGTKCQERCLKKYKELVAACPPNHGYAKSSRERLEGCKAELKHASPESEQKLDHELSEEEKAAKQATCLPYMLQMAAACHMDENPDPSAMCDKACQDSVSDLKEHCGDLLGASIPFDELLGMCQGCAGALMKIASPTAAAFKPCHLSPKAFQSGSVTGCAAGCRPFMCGLLDKCPEGKDPHFPGLSVAAIGKMRQDVGKAVKKCPC